MDDIKRELEAVNEFIYYAVGYPMEAISIANPDGTTRSEIIPSFLAQIKWTCPLSHMLNKWEEACASKQPYQYLIVFYLSLDRWNKIKLLEWIHNNYNFGKRLF